MKIACPIRVLLIVHFAVRAAAAALASPIPLTFVGAFDKKRLGGVVNAYR